MAQFYPYSVKIKSKRRGTSETEVVSLNSQLKRTDRDCPFEFVLRPDGRLAISKTDVHWRYPFVEDIENVTKALGIVIKVRLGKILY